MKTKAQPATVQKLDQNDHPILHSTKSARRISKANSSSPLGKNLKMSYQAFHNERSTSTYKHGTVRRSETIGEMARIYQDSQYNVPMTIFTRSQDRSRERNEVPGCRFRKIFGTDESEVLQSSRTFQQNQYVGLTAFIPEGDKNCIDPRIYVEQSIIRAGHEKIMIHELTFGDQLQTETDYVFRGIGDEHPVFGKRDLKVRLLSVNNESFETYMSAAGYYGYDRTEYVTINREMLNNGVAHPTKLLSWGKESYQKNITFDPTDLQILLDAKRKKEKDKEQGVSGELELLRFCMNDVLPSEDGRAVGGLNLRIVYKP